MNVLAEFQDDRLRPSVVVSIALHVSLLLFFVVAPSSLNLFQPKPIEILPSIRVDVIDLPQILKKDLENIDLTESAPEDAKVATPVEPKESAPPKPDEIKDFKEKDGPDRMKDQKRAIDRMREDLKRRQAIESLRQKKTPTVIGGNMVSQGTTLTGAQVREAHAYGGTLYTHMKRRWNLPPWLQNKDLKAVLKMWIGPDGNLIRKEFETSSGNSDFDSYVLRAAELSSPFPIPPPELVPYFSQQGIHVTFP